MAACSWASDDVEVIVRDNSGSQRKRAVLGQIDQANCRIMPVEPCDAMTNFRRVLDEATGDFVLYLADDDAGFSRGIAAIEAAAIRFAADPSVAGLTGAYLLEQTDRSQIVSYPKLDSGDVAERLAGYLGFQGPNLLYYSAIRRELQIEAWDFVLSNPIMLSFSDQINSLIYILGGKFFHVGRLTLVNDNANWEASDVGAKNDLKYYQAAGMDPAMRKLHWLVCAFEGAGLILNSRFAAAHTSAQRQSMANRWFEVMFRRFVGDTASQYDSGLMVQANQLHDKWRAPPGGFTLSEILADICDFVRPFSPEKAELYLAFWTAVLAGESP